MAKQYRRKSRRGTGGPADPGGGGGGGSGRGNAFRQARLQDDPQPRMEPGVRARAEDALGGSLDVQLTASGRAQDLDAAAVTQGRSIDVHPEALDGEGFVEPNLMAHELVHVRQQAADQPEQPGDVEQDARAGAAAIMAGQGYALQAGTGGAERPMQEDFLRWHQAFAHEESGEVTEVPRTYTGTDEAVWEPDPSDPQHAHAEGSQITTESSGTVFDQTDTFTHSVGGRDEQGRETLDQTRDEVRTQGLDTTGTRTHTDTVAHVDHEATARQVRSALEDTSAGLQTRIDELHRQIDELEMAAPEAEGEDPTAAQREALNEELFALREVKSQIDLAASSVDETNYDLIAHMTGARVEERLRQVGTTLQESVGREVDLSAGTFQTSSGTSYTHVAADGSTESASNSSSSTWSLDGGVGRESVTTDSSTSDSAGGDYVSEERQTTRGGGLVVGEDELGVRANSGTETTLTTGNGDERVSVRDSSSTSGRLTSEEASVGRVTEQQITTGEGDDATSVTSRREQNVGLGEDGLTGSAAGQTDRDFGAVSVRSRASSDGRFDVTLAELPGGRYQLVTTVRVGAELSGQLAAEGESETGATSNSDTQSQGSASASANAGASAQLVYRHLMTDAEVEDYLSGLDQAAEGQSGSEPEFDLIARMEAALDQAADGELGGLSVVDAQAAQQLQEGDSYELTTEVHAGGSVGGSGSHGAGSVGVEAGASQSLSRVLSVGAENVDGRRLTTITVRFVDTASWHAGGTVGYGVASGGGRYAESGSEGEGVTFRLDPELADYGALYDRVAGAMSPSAIEALADDEVLAPHLYGWQETETHTTNQDVDLGVGGVGLHADIDSSFSSDVSYNEDDGLEGTVTGSRTHGGTASVGDVEAHQDSVTGAAEGRVDEHGTRLDISTTDSSNSVANLGADHTTGAPGGSWIERAMGQAPAETLEREIRRTLTRVRGFTIDADTLRIVARRASDANNWSACWTSPGGTLNAWHRLRRELVDPQPEARWVEVDPVRAEQLAWCTSFAHFMEASGEQGGVAVHRCLRDWGMRMGQHEQRGADLGMMFEWPPMLGHLQDDYAAVEEAHATCQSDTASWAAAGPERAAEGREELLRHHSSARDLRNTIQECTDFTFPTAKLEMVGRLGEIMSELYGCVQLLSHDDPGACLGPDDPAVQEPQLRQRRQLLERDMRTFKREEQRLIARARENDNDNHELSRVEELHEFWIRQILELRSTYEALEVDPSSWYVSTGPHEPRNYQYEPEYLELNRLREAERYNYDAERESADRIRDLARY